MSIFQNWRQEKDGKMENFDIDIMTCDGRYTALLNKKLPFIKDIEDDVGSSLYRTD
jgi:hypothetical protein